MSFSFFIGDLVKLDGLVEKYDPKYKAEIKINSTPEC